MNKEFVLTNEQRVILYVYQDGVKYSARNLQSFLWDVVIEDQDDVRFFSKIWHETINCEDCSFNIENNILTIFEIND